MDNNNNHHNSNHVNKKRKTNDQDVKESWNAFGPVNHIVQASSDVTSIISDYVVHSFIYMVSYVQEKLFLETTESSKSEKLVRRLGIFGDVSRALEIALSYAYNSGESRAASYNSSTNRWTIRDEQMYAFMIPVFSNCLLIEEFALDLTPVDSKPDALLHSYRLCNGLFYQDIAGELNHMDRSQRLICTASCQPYTGFDDLAVYKSWKLMISRYLWQQCAFLPNPLKNRKVIAPAIAQFEQDHPWIVRNSNKNNNNIDSKDEFMIPWIDQAYRCINHGHILTLCTQERKQVKKYPITELNRYCNVCNRLIRLRNIQQEDDLTLYTGPRIIFQGIFPFSIERNIADAARADTFNMRFLCTFNPTNVYITVKTTD